VSFGLPEIARRTDVLVSAWSVPQWVRRLCRRLSGGVRQQAEMNDRREPSRTRSVDRSVDRGDASVDESVDDTASSDLGPAEQARLFEEISEYLASTEGRYDALIAALIIRSR